MRAHRPEFTGITQAAVYFHAIGRGMHAYLLRAAFIQKGMEERASNPLSLA